MNTVLNAFLLSLLAGLGTGVGGLIAVMRRPGQRMFGLIMGFAAGVMVALSFLELVNHAWELAGFLPTTIGFGAGALLMFAIDVLTPHIRFGEAEGAVEADLECPDPPASSALRPRPFFLRGRPLWRRGHGGRGLHKRKRRQFRGGDRVLDPKLYRTGLLVALGVTIHNIPEGIVVGAGYAHAPRFGVFIAIAIALHNIPEGIATALPLCGSGLSRWKSFRTALLSGLVEPIGALAAAALLTTVGDFTPIALAFAGGVMVFITLDELVPTAREYGHQHFTAIGIIVGALFVFVLSGTLGI